MRTFARTLLTAVILFLLSAAFVSATPEFADQTGKTCAFCHDGAYGGPLNHVGVAFVRGGYDYPIPERILDKSIALSGTFHKTLRLIIGAIHLVTVSILVGSIFYIHIVVKPWQLKGGVPRGEKRLGLSCLITILATGIYLTWYRIDSMGSFFKSGFGVLLFIKIMLFIAMLVLAVLAVTVVTRKMRSRLKVRESQAAGVEDGAERGDFDLKNLLTYDGKEGRPAYFLYKNKVYDVSASEKWKDGVHFRAHNAGENLTENLANAPHGEEVFEKFSVVKEVSEEETASGSQQKRRQGIDRVFIVMTYVNLALVFFILLCVAGWLWGFSVKKPPVSEVTVLSGFETELVGLAGDESDCLRCHSEYNPGILVDWSESIHAKVNVTCWDCHRVTEPDAPWVSVAHLEHSQTPVSGIVTPDRCSMCHEEEVEQYAKSKHANTLRIINTVDKWLIHGMNNQIERTTGCYACHGTRVVFEDNRPVNNSWPNVGVGRENPDGTFGSCTSCHTRHSFSVEEARKPEACDQCHLGPDHPQIEIYNESKHGTIYHAEGNTWTWRPDDFTWTAGVDYRAPTCATCHMSEAPGVAKSHDVTERLAWETQAPLTIRPSEFAPFPASTDWREEREKMKAVCSQCHSEQWVSGHFDNMDTVIKEYNDIYYKPAVEVMGELYAQGALSEDEYFDEELEWEFYELWHHEGRRARMGAAMMAPDYAWWHGFYELKHRFVHLMELAEEHTAAARSHWLEDFPGRLEPEQ